MPVTEEWSEGTIDESTTSTAYYYVGFPCNVGSNPQIRFLIVIQGKFPDELTAMMNISWLTIGIEFRTKLLGMDLPDLSPALIQDSLSCSKLKSFVFIRYSQQILYISAFGSRRW